MENRKIQFRSKACNLHLSAYPGHFATKHSHVNYFLDMTTLKVRQSNAEEAARALVPLYKHNTVVDTIVCLDGTEVIGAFLAEKLTESGFFSYNQHLMASVTTGITINRSWECIEYYGGKLQGISAIFSTLSEYGNLPVNSLFTPNDIPTYHTYSKHDCPYCKSGQKIDALVNGHGYSELL